MIPVSFQATFGSFGDLATLAGLLYLGYKSIGDCRGSKSEYQKVQKSLEDISLVVTEFWTLYPVERLSLRFRDRIQSDLASLDEALKCCEDRIQSFSEWNSAKITPLKSVEFSVRWRGYMSKEVSSFRNFFKLTQSYLRCFMQLRKGDVAILSSFDGNLKNSRQVQHATSAIL